MTRPSFRVPTVIRALHLAQVRRSRPSVFLSPLIDPLFYPPSASGRTSRGSSSFSFQKDASIPNSICDRMTRHRLKHRHLHSTSLTIATSVRLRTASPKRRLIALNVLSTFDRL